MVVRGHHSTSRTGELERAVKFWLSGEVQADVSDVYIGALKEIRNALNEAVGDLDVGPVGTWGFIAIIREVDTAAYDEVMTYHRGEGRFEFRLRIDHGEFFRSDQLGKRRLVMTALLRSVQEARTVAPAAVDLDRIEQAMLIVAQAHDWIRQN